MLRRALFAAVALLAAAPVHAQSGKTLKVVMQSDLKIIDPVWTTAYIVRNHGYLIYDTLFALDAKLEPRPQMIESWTVSDDQLTWTFKLREGLKWHDGQPVTTADVLPSIKRFTDKDTLGGLLGKQTQEMKALDDRTFQIVLNKPYGMMLKTLAKTSSIPPFIMPIGSPRRRSPSRSPTRRARAPSSSRRTNGSPARRSSICAIPTTGRAPSRPRAWPAARSRRSTASNGWRCPTSRRRRPH